MEYLCECGKDHIFKCHKCGKRAPCSRIGNTLLMGREFEELEFFSLCDSCMQDTFCFIQPERLSEKTPQGDAIV